MSSARHSRGGCGLHCGRGAAVSALLAASGAPLQAVFITPKVSRILNKYFVCCTERACAAVEGAAACPVGGTCSLFAERRCPDQRAPPCRLPAERRPCRGGHDRRLVLKGFGPLPDWGACRFLLRRCCNAAAPVLT